MNCPELFLSLVNDTNKAEKIDKQHPDCLCEGVSVSPHSDSGPVQNNEMVWRLILSPIHHDESTGKIKEFAFRDVWDKGMSVLREDVIGSQDAIVQRGKNRAASKTGCQFEYAVGARVGKIRELRSQDILGRFCVYDTAELDEPAHADICQTRHPGKSARSILRRELQKLFVHTLPDGVQGVL